MNSKIFNLFTIFSICLLLTLTNCTTDEPKNPQDDWNQGSDSGSTDSDDDDRTNDTSLSEAQIKQLISKYVRVEAWYKDYLTNFKITSTLHQHIKGGKIKFGVGHGDVNGTTNVLVASQAFKYSEWYSNDVFYVEIGNPFWFYYMFGVEEEYGNSASEIAALSEIYYNSYVALMAKDPSTLTADERELLKTIKQRLGDYLYDAKYDYKQSIMVTVDGKKYYTVATYNSNIFQ